MNLLQEQVEADTSDIVSYTAKFDHDFNEFIYKENSQYSDNKQNLFSHLIHSFNLIKSKITTFNYSC